MKNEAPKTWLVRAYCQGYEARLKKLPHSRNPWRNHPGVISRAWMNGWRHADMESLEKVENPG